MPRLKLTDAAVSKLKLPSKPKQVDYWDTLVPAFGLRVSYSGAKAWVVVVRILDRGEWKQTRVTLGRYPALGLSAARDKAREAKAAAQSGQNLRHRKDAERRALEANSLNTWGAARDRFLRQYSAERHKPKTAAEYRRVLTSADFAAWETRPIATVTKADVFALLDTMVEAGTKIKANRTLAYLRKMFNWAVSRGVLGAAPTDRIAPPAKEMSRDRVLSEQEIAVAWEAFDAAGPFAALFKLLLVTAQRENEVARMHRAELRDLSGQPLWELSKERTKNGTAHRVPLSPLAVQILSTVPDRGPLVFTTTGATPLSGFSRAKRRVDAKIAALVRERELENVFVKPWRLHDLRRTAKTHMSELGIPPYVSELICNHKRKGIEAVYDHSELLPEKRRALELWATRIKLLTTETGKVLPMRLVAA